MTRLGEYVLGVFCAALICGIVSKILGKKGVHGKLIQMLCGIFLVICIASPLVHLSFGSWEDLHLGIKLDALAAADQGQIAVKEEYRQVITRQTTTYILDKAKNLGLELAVSVTLNDDDLSAPKAVTLRGRVSPYAKQVLSAWITEELGIEEQEWISSD